MKSKKKRSNDAVADVIGIVMMLGIAISLIAMVYISVLSYPFTPSPISADLIGSVDGNSIIIEHHGGDTLGLDTEIVITVGGTTTRITVEDYLDDESKADGLWNIGERVVYTPVGGITDYLVKATVVDVKSNSAILMGILQDGEIFPLSTSVNTISPYEITFSPLTTTVTGDLGLDNVTLYYRWSEDNWTISWTTLTYDDFEGASFNWGNYTDGGVDCLEYTSGTYAHQGSNAVDIQDDSGDASSFYHTSGIDVDTPGYTSIKVDFWFYSVGLDSGHDFFVEYNDGSTWQTVATYVQGTDFVNGQFYHEVVWIDETSYTFSSNMQIKFRCDAGNNNDDVYIDEIYVNATTGEGDRSSWAIWNDASNPDEESLWSWEFDFPNSVGYYEFYSIGIYNGDAEDAPSSADAICKYEE